MQIAEMSVWCNLLSLSASCHKDFLTVTLAVTFIKLVALPSGGAEVGWSPANAVFPQLMRVALTSNLVVNVDTHPCSLFGYGLAK